MRKRDLFNNPPSPWIVPTFVRHSPSGVQGTSVSRTTDMTGLGKLCPMAAGLEGQRFQARSWQRLREDDMVACGIGLSEEVRGHHLSFDGK